MNWEPFIVVPKEKTAPRPLMKGDVHGIADRLRAAAFAELQAENGFLWAATYFQDASIELRNAWRALAAQERKHRHWLLQRLEELNIPIGERPVSTALWDALTTCTTAREFALLMADAEERGKKAGFRFYEKLKTVDPTTALIFRTIAEEEQSHIDLAFTHFPNSD